MISWHPIIAIHIKKEAGVFTVKDESKGSQVKLSTNHGVSLVSLG
jgi:hypothetical protein